MEEMRNSHKILVRDLKGWEHLESVGVEESVILIWILKKLDRRCGLVSFWIRTGTNENAKGWGDLLKG